MDRETPDPQLEPRDQLSLPARLEAILYLKGRALSLGELAEIAAVGRDQAELGLITLMADYAHRDTAGIVPSVAVNQILDELDEVLRPPVGPAFKQTLGGLVEHCWIEGEIHTDEGWLGLQSIAVVPLRMLVVAN